MHVTAEAPEQDPQDPYRSRVARRVGRFRQWLAVGALTGSAVLVLVSGLVTPSGTGDSAGMYRAAVDQPSRLAAGALLLAVSSLLLIPGVVGTARLVRGRGRVVAGFAATFGVMGALGHVAYSVYALVISNVPGPGTTRTDAIDLMERIDSDPAVGALVVPMIAGYALCVLLLPIALYRGRIVSLWAIAPAAVGVAIEVVNLGSGWPAVAKYAMAIASAVVISVGVLRLTEREWADPPIVPTRRDRSAQAGS